MESLHTIIRHRQANSHLSKHLASQRSKHTAICLNKTVTMGSNEQEITLDDIRVQIQRFMPIPQNFRIVNGWLEYHHQVLSTRLINLENQLAAAKIHFKDHREAMMGHLGDRQGAQWSNGEDDFLAQLTAEDVDLTPADIASTMGRSESEVRERCSHESLWIASNRMTLFWRTMKIKIRYTQSQLIWISNVRVGLERTAKLVAQDNDAMRARLTERIQAQEADDTGGGAGSSDAQEGSWS